ncbi:receptor-type tyrosine-protein phosphatase epsilon-like [Apostichopus japonicus]|uniref:receptor-type tyrosine-protein phosphatase epsilon-like n=1 Tax=Stichopus japonicus TaxID=307972 RepID=UPI003AB3AE72
MTILSSNIHISFLSDIVIESSSQVNPQSSVEIKSILEGSTAVVNRLQIRLSRSEGAIDDHGITQETDPEISANRREETYRVISVSEDDQFFCILSLGASIVGSINVTGFVYKLPSISDPPSKLTRTTTSVTITWRPWDEETDVGDPPVVAYIPYYKMDPSQDWMSGSRIQADQTLEYTASSLESDRKYTFSVAAVREGEGGEGPRGPAVTIKTLCIIDVVPQMVTTTVTVTNDVTVTWQKPTVQCSTGITQFTIYYEIEGDVTSRQEAGTADPNAESFTFDGSLLEPGTTYNIAVTVTTDQESTLSEGRTVTATKPTGSSGSSVAIIIIISVVIVVLIVLIPLFLIVIVVRKRKMKDQPDPIDNQPLNDIGNRSGPSGNTYHSSGAVNTALNVTEAKKTKESSAANSSVLDVGGIYGNLEPPSPIRIAEFPEYIISNIDKVEHEFGLLEGVQQKHPWTVAEEEYNRKKNRFRNMYPYDHCRVVLPKLPGDHHSDYYNASFILNERDVRAYIASQAPNKASVDDFWRLIWEQNVQTIVMLANLYEDTKERCLQYWPKEENETQCFGYINVTWTKTQHFADYVIRTLSVERGGTIREVKQLHFKEWPDKDVPDSAMCLVEFARHCKLIHFKKQTPLLIHCSAGIGRTGTFIGLLSMMDVLQSKEYIDIFAFVNKMRENRVNMIQTKKQYRYLHTCLYEFHLTRDCQISAQILSRFKIHDNKAAILREFELLSEVEMSKTNDSPKTGGTTDSLARGNSTDSLETGGSMKTEHAPRDRFGNMVPTGGRKVFMLSSSPSNPDNYINASFVKSYEKKDAFITTQSPLPNTIEDFWRMIYDHKCRTVVMLNQLDKSDKTCVQYWPDRGSLQYGIMTVTCIATEQQSDYVKRTFDVSLNDSANVISVTHLQLEEWPPNGSPQSVIRLITDAQKLQKEANIEKPLVVHCINGFGRSGVFVTVQSEMERIRATGLVDIFATVKKLRNEHQHMMRKKMDYILCFDFLIEFSKRYGNYENW